MVGDRGPLGPKGEIGTKGPQGPTAIKGIKGIQGKKGPLGIGGDTIKGLKGVNGPNGDIGPTGPQGSQGPASDRRLKDNIKTLKGNLSKLQLINGIRFTWKGGATKFSGRQGEDIGFIAQEIKIVVPEVVSTGEDGYLRVEYGKLVAIAIGGIQEQHTRILSIKERINLLKSEVLNG